MLNVVLMNRSNNVTNKEVVVEVAGVAVALLVTVTLTMTASHNRSNPAMDSLRQVALECLECHNKELHLEPTPTPRTHMQPTGDTPITLRCGTPRCNNRASSSLRRSNLDGDLCLPDLDSDLDHLDLCLWNGDMAWILVHIHRHARNGLDLPLEHVLQ